MIESADKEKLVPKYGYRDIIVDGKEEKNVLCLLGADGAPNKKLDSDVLSLLTNRGRTIRKMVGQLVLDASAAGYDYDMFLLEMRPKQVKSTSGTRSGTIRVTKPYRFFTGGWEKHQGLLDVSADFAGYFFCQTAGARLAPRVAEVRVCLFDGQRLPGVDTTHTAAHVLQIPS